MRRGHIPSVKRLRSLCEVLGLEFYVGPPRWRRIEDGGVLPDVPLRALERTAQDLAQLTVDAGGNPISDDLWPVLVARRSSELPGADKGPPAEGRWDELGSIFAAGPADGQGTSTEDRGDQVSLTGKWLDGHGVQSGGCAMFSIRDGSMEPTLPNGCLTLVDRASRAWQPPRIMAVQLGEEMVFRRAATGDDGRRLMVCDHPDWPDDPWPDSAQIVGQVLWVGHWPG